jgi:hypothetical protein
MTAWSADQLDRVGTADELELCARRADGTLKQPVTIWVVRVGDELFVRSYRGPDSRWYRDVTARPPGHIASGGVESDVRFTKADARISDLIDSAYREKYARVPSYVGPMLTDQARATTLQLAPEEPSL